MGDNPADLEIICRPLDYFLAMYGLEPLPNHSLTTGLRSIIFCATLAEFHFSEAPKANLGAAAASHFLRRAGVRSGMPSAIMMFDWRSSRLRTMRVPSGEIAKVSVM